MKRDLPIFAAALLVALAAGADTRASWNDDDDDDDVEDVCSETASLLFKACQAEIDDDALVGEAICINLSDEDEREDCLDELEDAGEEADELCRGQRETRLETCEALGEEAYDPKFVPALFDPPKSPTKPNPYYPLKVGNRWTYRGGDEDNTVEVLNETKRMPSGVKCIVVRDIVRVGGELREDTDDWFAHAKNGSTWYCGEEVKDYESFDGDSPRKPELVSIDGSFKAGRDGAKPGVIFLAAPKAGDVYLEEFSLGNAEDLTEVLSTTYAYGKDDELDDLVPAALAKHLCPGNCVVTKNFSHLEPGIFALKYYARGIGFFLEVKPEEEEVLQLVGCNFHNKCKNLPQP